MTETMTEAAKIRPGEDLPQEIVELFEKHEKYLAAGRSNYRRADAILEKLLKRCEIGVEVVLPEKGKGRSPRKLTLVDQFADTNKVWAGSSCSRFKIASQDVKPQER